MTENEDYNEEELILAADEIIFACDYLSSLEIQVNQEDSKDIHLAYKKEKENNIKKFLKYSINLEPNESNCDYLGTKFIFNTKLSDDTCDTYFLISSTGTPKSGMIDLVGD